MHSNNKVYSLDHGGPPVLSAPTPHFPTRVGHDLLLLHRHYGIVGRRVTYWSLRDPHRSQSIDFGDWQFEQRTDDLFLFRHATKRECLFWIWGASTAVRINTIFHYIKVMSECGGVAFVTQRYRHRVYTVFAVDLRCERTQDYPPPTSLPTDAPLVEARVLLHRRGGPTVHPVLGPGGDGEPPYLALRHNRCLFEVK